MSSSAANASAFSGLTLARLASPCASAILSLLWNSMSLLQSEIERLAARGSPENEVDARSIFLKFRAELTNGSIRAAEKIDGAWRVNAWVKQGILLGFRL